MAIRVDKYDVDTFVNDKISEMLTEYAKKNNLVETTNDDLVEEFFGLWSPIHEIAEDLADFIESWGNALKEAESNK